MALEHKLPNGLLIILHLHLLNFPLQNAGGYDERLFHRTRGTRERNKAMEDITYFLVGRLEGSKERAKSILPAYPCLQPSDTVAYRIALAKYLEGLRNAIVHTKHAHLADPKGKQPASSTEDEAAAWWWKDVVVRKSILEECSGERFERLILALSSHAILKNAVRTQTRPSSLYPPAASSSASGPQDRERDVCLLSTAYTTQLAVAQNARFEWERSTALLVQRQADLAVIRARIADPKLAASSKYDGLTTDRLLALRDSRYQDLLRRSWQGDDGRSALRLVTDLAGLLEASTSIAADSASSEDVSSESKLGFTLPNSQPQATPETPPPLPIAAAHHPAHLHSLGLPLFAPPRPSHSQGGDSQDEGAGPSTPHSISERLAAIEKVHASLQDALIGARSIHAQLQQRLQRAKTEETPRPSISPREKAPVKGNNGLQLDVSLWDRRGGKSIDFKKVPDAPMFACFSLDSTAPSETAIEDRIAYIRTTLLPPFTAEHLLASDSEPEPEPEPPSAKPPAAGRASRLRQPTARGPVPTAVPKANHHGGAVTGSTLPGPSSKVKPTRQVRAADGRMPPPQRVLSGTGRTVQGDSTAAAMKARRLSRRASAARTRRSTMIGRGEDVDILRIVESVEDRSDPSEEDDIGAASDMMHMYTEGPTGHAGPRTPFRTPRRTPGKGQGLGTRGTLLSTLKQSAPRQSFDIDKYERVRMPRLPSLGLGGLEAAPEEDDATPTSKPSFRGDAAGGEDEPRTGSDSDCEDDVPYEGNSTTLADILLHAGHQGNVSVQLLDEDEVEGDMSDWE
ncbi:hypothetical protein LXA43DRAFT_1177865 [Ganoderma leucocontextum]|nr:hypothetical protein LXA43DRAFT_1177865 [Ganoderma leucocontextum]